MEYSENVFILAGLLFLAVMIGLLWLAATNSTLAGGYKEDSNWQPPEKGTQHTFDSDSQHSRTEEVIGIGEPDGKGN